MPVENEIGRLVKCTNITYSPIPKLFNWMYRCSEGCNDRIQNCTNFPNSSVGKGSYKKVASDVGAEVLAMSDLVLPNLPWQAEYQLLKGYT